MSLNYRHEIDGLRAVAVLAVILFHAGFTTFSGGFVGVDVFFVISGYLITSILVKDVGAGTFNFRDFYERRARRILPALFVVLLCCIPFAWMWMMPMELKGFSIGVVSVCLFVSNFLFWRQSGYFDTAAELKPLLHTWSLSVEEQYYIIVPIIILLLWRLGRRNVIWSIAILAILSLALSEYASRYHPLANFYMLPTRAWELMAGALCSFAVPRPSLVRDNVLSLVGLSAVVVSVFAFNEAIPVPSLYALLPVVGTCAVILFAQVGTLVQATLSFRPIAGIGLISYSAYLWHQPLFAFARIRTLTDPTWQLMLALAGASLLLGYFSWRFVEVPFRKPGAWPLSDRRFVLSMFGGLAAAFIFAGLAGYITNGFLRSFTSDTEMRLFIQAWDNTRPEWHYFVRTGLLEKFGDECNFFDHDSYRRGVDTTLPRSSISPSCYARLPEKKYSLFIWGDSHAQMLRYGLQNSLPKDWQVLQVASSGCAPSVDFDPRQYCNLSNEVARKAIIETKPDVVLLAQAWEHDATKLSEIAQLLIDHGVKRVVVTGPAPQWRTDLPMLIVKNFWHESKDRTFVGLRKGLFDLNDMLKDRLGEGGQIDFVSLTDVFCNEDGCLMYIDGDQREGLVSWDYGHLTPTASLYLAKHGLASAITSGFSN